MIYLIHFDTPYPRDDRSPVRHYLGWSSSGPHSRGMIRRRLDAHARGTGSRLMRAVSLAGIGWRVVRIWPHGDRTQERRLKRQRNLSRFCPVCKGERVTLRAAYWRHDPVLTDTRREGMLSL